MEVCELEILAAAMLGLLCLALGACAVADWLTRGEGDE